jgi:hypothetical protein
MNSHEELLYLRHVQKHLDADVPSIITNRWLPLVGWLVAVAYFFVLLQFQPRLPALAFLGLSCLAGIVVGALAFWRICSSKWPYVRPHLDGSSIARRVRELES